MQYNTGIIVVCRGYLRQLQLQQQTSATYVEEILRNMMSTREKIFAMLMLVASGIFFAITGMIVNIRTGAGSGAVASTAVMSVCIAFFFLFLGWRIMSLEQKKR